MKKILSTLLIIILAFSIAFADIIQDINGALKTGNSKVISSFFNTSVELNLPGNEGIYSKSQAELMLKDFFTKNPTKNFTSKHDGASPDGSKYSIGSLETTSGTYRTYFYLKNKNGSFLIKEFRVEKEK